jgi:2-keto-4-pentenoate hydratase/2-oxohepta-3-ene-1,7-dioic acid hydratase in catechol pathway
MKLVTYESANGPRLGAVVNDQIVDLHTASGGSLPGDMLSLLQGGPGMLAQAASVAEGASGQPADQVKLLAPIANPSKIVAIGLNYMDHCIETNAAVPKQPLIFTKFTTSIVGPGDAIRWDPALTSQVDYEAELAVVIGRTASNVSEEEALEYVAGYTICHDVSARDLQFGDGQWVRGKSLDTFCPLGPWLVTGEEVADPHNLGIRCVLNGHTVQDSNTRELIFNVPTLVAYCSRSFTLLPGDIIITGTPSGVGVSRKPQLFLKHGDVVTVEIDGLGSLTSPCVEEASA